MANPPNPPTASGNNETVSPDTTIPLGSLFDYAATNGNTILGFDVKQITNDGGRLYDNGIIEPTGTLLDGGNYTYGIPIAEIGQWSFVAAPAAGLSDVLHFNVDAANTAYNTQGAAATITTEATPSLSRVSPTSYPSDNNLHPMELFGSNFQKGDTLTFKDQNGTVYPSIRNVSFNSSGELSYEFDDSKDPGTWTVAVDGPNGKLQSNYVSFTVASVQPAPSLSRVSPTSYPSDNNLHPMELFGSNFQKGDTLTFKDQNGTVYPSIRNVSFNSSGELSYEFDDSKDPGTWTVAVDGPNGKLQSNYKSFMVKSSSPPPSGPESGVDASDSFIRTQIANGGLSQMQLNGKKFIGIYLGNESTYLSAAEVKTVENYIPQITSFYEYKLYDTNPKTKLYTNQWVSYLENKDGNPGAILDPNRAYEAGQYDASRAYTAAQRIDQPGHSAIYFAIDLNPAAPASGISESEAISKIDQYFSGVAEYLSKQTIHYSIGVYGAGDTLTSVTKNVAVQYAWLTQKGVWPGGDAWAGATATHQYSVWQNTTSNTGFDTDVSSTAYFGQWGGSGAILPPSTPCFAEGTRLLIRFGETAVQKLRAGEHAVLADGSVARILWIGRRRIDLTRHPRPEAVQPILIMADAIADGVPSGDLVLSPDHALFLDGHLIPAKILENGHTIRQVCRRSVTYYHVELDRHAVLLAEGTPCESYLETGNRGTFENSDEPMVLHPDLAQQQREARGCAPFAESGPAVEAVRRRLLERAAIACTDDPAWTGRVRPDGAFVIESRSDVPGLLTPDPRDRRRLGVKIAALSRADGRAIPLDHTELTVGWHDPEADGRWTDGAAVVPANLTEGEPIAVTLAATCRYRVADGCQSDRRVEG